MWFTETPWPPIFIGIAGMVLLGAAWLQNARKLYLGGFVALGLACLAIYGFERWYVTEPEKVEQRVYDLAAAVEEDDVDGVLQFIAEDQSALRNKVRVGMSQFRVDGGLRVTDVDAHFNDERTAIISRLRANGTVASKLNSAASRHVATMWEFTWKKEGDQWRIVKIQRLDPLKEEPIDMFSREE